MDFFLNLFPRDQPLHNLDCVNHCFIGHLAIYTKHRGTMKTTYIIAIITHLQHFVTQECHIVFNYQIVFLEMNVAKTIEVKEPFDTVQVSFNDVNRCLHNVQFESSMIRSYARNSLNKIGVEEKLVDHLDTTKQLITGLTDKVEKLNLSKTEEPFPNSFLVKRSIKNNLSYKLSLIS